MNSIKKDLGVIQVVLLLYIILYSACVVFWGKDLYLYLINNTQPSKFSIVLAITITITAMGEMLIKNLKELIEWIRISR